MVDAVETPDKAMQKLSINKDTEEMSNGSKANETEAAGNKDDKASPIRTAVASLYVGELDRGVNEAILFEVFSQYGPLTSIRVCRDAVTRESLGYAYVNFTETDDAKKAMAELNYARINGIPCRIMWMQHDPSIRKSGKGNIFIKNLDPSIDNKSLHDTFAAFGDILSCKVATDHEGNSLGHGFVHFATPEAADEAIKVVNGMVLNNKPVYVAHYVSKDQRVSKSDSNLAIFTNVYVKNLPDSVDDAELKKMFEPFGETTSIFLSTDNDGRSRNFGFVNFAEHESAQKAIDDMNGKEIDGKKLYVGRAQTKSERKTALKKQFEQSRLENATKYLGVNLYVRNLDDSITDEKLKEAFAPFGTITSARVMLDPSGKSRGFGFVCFSSPEEATRAIGEMNQHILGAKPLYVTFAQRKEQRMATMRQQFNARHQLRLQQQAAVAGGLPAQFLSNPLVYGAAPTHTGFPGASGANRVPFPPNAQMMMPPRNAMPQLGQWQAGPGAPRGAPVEGYPPGAFPTGAAGGANAAPPSAAVAAAAAAGSGVQSLAAVVAVTPEEAKKQVIGEALYPKILAQPEIANAELAGKITGMLLDMENDELIALAGDDAALKEQVREALSAYNAFLESQKVK